MLARQKMPMAKHTMGECCGNCTTSFCGFTLALTAALTSTNRGHRSLGTTSLRPFAIHTITTAVTAINAITTTIVVTVRVPDNREQGRGVYGGPGCGR